MGIYALLYGTLVLGTSIPYGAVYCVPQRWVPSPVLSTRIRVANTGY